MAGSALSMLRDSIAHPLRCTRAAAVVRWSTLLCAVMVAPALFAQAAIGHVLDIKGDWYLYSGGADSNEGQNYLGGRMFRQAELFGSKRHLQTIISPSSIFT